MGGVSSEVLRSVNGSFGFPGSATVTHANEISACAVLTCAVVNASTIIKNLEITISLVRVRSRSRPEMEGKPKSGKMIDMALLVYLLRSYLPV